MKDEAELMQKEFDKIGKPKGTSVVRASTSDSDFEKLIKSQMQQIKKFNR